MLPEEFSLYLFPDDPVPIEWEPTEEEIACALELNTLSTFRSQFRHLRTRFHSFVAMLEAPAEKLDSFPEGSGFLRDRYVDQRAGLRVGTERAKVPGNVTIVTYFDSRYPLQLRGIYNPPPVLYVRGDISFDYNMSLAIVGSRAFTDYGRQTAELFAYQLASWGFTIVSGGARGIDSVAHHAVLNARGKTLSVLGSGIDVVFPAENKDLFGRIAESGAVITEFPMGTIPDKFNFPMRNRIIAALSRGTLVIEAPEKSGALITAELALQCGRDVFAVPGRITDGRSKGTNLLIRDGAHIALDPCDVPLRFGLIVLDGASPGSEKIAAQLEGDEALVYTAVTLEAKPADAIVREVGISAPRVLAALLILLTRGLVKELPGSRFVRPVGGPKLPREKDGEGELVNNMIEKGDN
jgi:DNA processing protein